MKKIVAILILTILLSNYVLSQDRMVQGKVTNKWGRPIAGVSVMAKRISAYSTITDVDGRFLIMVPDFVGVLVISFIGMETIEINIANNNDINIKLKRKKKLKNSYFSIEGDFAIVYSEIYSSDIFNDDYWSAKGNPSGNLRLILNYFFNKNYGIGVGLGLSVYYNELSLTKFDNTNLTKPLLVDKDGDRYYRIIRATIVEKNQIVYLDMPIIFKMRFNTKGKVNYYLNLGVEASYLSQAEYETIGETTHTGEYPDYNVLLSNLDDYGFNTVTETETSKYSMREYNFSGYFSAGVILSLKKRFKLKIGPNIKYSLLPIKYETAKHRDDYINTIYKTTEITTRFWGLNFGLIYKF